MTVALTKNQQRVERARRAAAVAPALSWTERVLLAAAEAAEATVPAAMRAEVACAIADKAAHAAAVPGDPRALRVAVVDALASVEVHVPSRVLTALVWRLVFDLWGGPGR